MARKSNTYKHSVSNSAQQPKSRDGLDLHRMVAWSRVANKHTTYLLLSQLLVHADYDTGECTVSMETLMKNTQCCYDTIKSGATWLIDNGYLRVIENPGKTNTWKVMLDKLQTEVDRVRATSPAAKSNPERDLVERSARIAAIEDAQLPPAQPDPDLDDTGCLDEPAEESSDPEYA